jgi:hypothetical protein
MNTVFTTNILVVGTKLIVVSLANSK